MHAIPRCLRRRCSPRSYLLGLQGHYATGLADLKRAESLYDEIDLPVHALTALNGIAILYNRMGDYTQARYMYDRALKAQRETGMYREQGVTLHNLGRVHENLLEWDAAQAAFQETYDISHQLNYARGEAYALRGLAAVKNAKGDPEARFANPRASRGVAEADTRCAPGGANSSGSRRCPA